ncbi:MAG: hypothetical protein R2824_21465 [Saprospiraceae bacterium]|nr:hypothetical protein [Lewinella sp.]
MKFLPYENLTIRSELTTSELKQRLMAEIEPKKLLRSPFKKNNLKPYEGNLTGDTFEINRIIHYRNSFLPVIKGRILSDAAGAKVEVKLRLNIMVQIFAAIWMVGVTIAFVAMLIASIREGQFGAVIFIPLGMLLFLYLMTTGGFKAESGRTKKDLLAFFEGEVEDRNLLL